ncbi:MAG TPA: FIST N-terminal domain-containing protein [Candidatus Binatia bacterium]|jgi:small ligand-binding sensory domain FIST|nr:FIST N-terminal domain-containing protein [Candidatus Binatia bacterium]
MQWSSSASRAARLATAVEEAVAPIRSQLDGVTPDLVVAFVSPQHRAEYDAMPELVRAALGPRTFIGCSAGGVIGGGHELEDEPGVSLTAAVLPNVTLTPFHRDLPDVPMLPAPPQHFLLLPDPFSFDADAFVHTLDEAYPTSTVIGGVASGGREPGSNALWLDGTTHRGGVVGLALDGDIAVDTIVAQGCRPIGEPMFVTRSERNVIHDLDGRRAAVILQDLYARSEGPDQRLFRESLFLGIVMREAREQYQQGDFLIRNLLGIEPKTGSLVVGALVRDGMVVQFHLRDARTSADDLDELLRRHEGTPHGALLFSCLGRGKGLYGVADHDTDAFHARFGAVALGGFFCNGEIGPVHGTTFLHGYTSAFGLFRPR